MNKFIYSFLLVFVSISSIYAQSFSITGKILDTEGPIVGAYVTVLENKQVAPTDANGVFVLKDLASGKYTLKAQFIGYLSQELEVTVKRGNVTLDDIVLTRDYLQLEQVVVTATRNEILRKDAPIVCNLLDKKILKATQSVVLSEGLSFQPALRVETNCQNCGFNGLRMNGLDGAYSQILIDGRPTYNSLQGVYGLEQIPANMIERVEIVRSGGSALYGSSAVAGTVNIITKEPMSNNAYFTTNQALIGGESPDQTYMLGGEVISKDYNSGITVNLFHRDRDYWDANEDGFSEIGELRATSLSFKAFYKPSKLSKITFNGFNINEYRRGGNKFDKPFHQTDITESTTHNIWNGGLTYEQFLPNQDHKFSTYISYQNLVRDSYYGAGEDPNAYGDSEDNGLVAGVQYTGNLGRFAGGEHTLVTGIEYTYNNLEDNAPAYDRYIDQTTQQFSVYVQDDWDLGEKFDILLGTRFDKHNLINDPIVSPRANVLYKINEELQFRVGYARGFRTPQVFDEDLHITQVNGEGTVITNSEDLTPEFSNAFSTSLDYNKYFENWSIGFTIDGFYTELTDVFILEEQGNDENGDLLLERRNGAGARVSGITLNPKVQYKDKINLQIGYTFQNSEYDEPVQWSESVPNTSRRFFRTPDQYGFYVFAWKVNRRFALNLSGVYTGSMIAEHYEGYIEQDVLETTPTFFEQNIKIEYTPRLKNKKFDLNINAGIQNITDAYQQDFDLGIDRDAGYVYGPGRPRTFFVGLMVNFGQ